MKTVLVNKIINKLDVIFMTLALNQGIECKLENLVSFLRNETLQTDYYAEVVTIAENLGFKVFNVNFKDNNVSGYIEVDADAPENNKISVNASHCDARKRFTIAHEIGHYVLEHLNSDCKKYRKIDYDNNDNSSEERQANKFAATLLMPKKMISEVWKQFKDIKITASTFGVSQEACAIRLSKLNLV